MKTYSPKRDEAERAWWVIDAEDMILGRLASRASTLLRGKHKPTFAPHVDMGDYVVVINADKVAVTGRRLEQKTYYRHSGYPGGIRDETLAELLARRPERVIRLAVRGMLPRNRMGRQMISKLKVYAGSEHPHDNHRPQRLDLEAWPAVRAVEPAES